MDLQLQNKVIIITGGKNGIGKGIVLSIAAEGAIPVIINRSPVDDEFVADITAVTDTYEYYQLDLNDTDGIAPIVEEVYKKYGHIDGIVNNAGANDNCDLENTSWRDFEKSLHGNLTHYYELVHQAVGYLKESQGSIVNIGSKTALTGQGKTSAYAAAKGAILGLTREWAAALAEDNVRVNAIVVAEAWTPLYARWIKSFGDEAAQKARLALIEDKIPLGKRMTSTEEIGDMAAFLLSPRSSHTTGQWLHPDGGYVHLDRALN
ncbi:SDR family oxidoreductase [Actinotignum urinale]|uniref:SDR family oxidoreductase n=1 Tax=Actinotignum urinale TaxID=190146 RepID=A0AAW9HQ17_9ACTO|nr:SDR family oxidoreductase [Actinotignum urinale]MDY5128971.1 SDR family oxidoreductase [Actinotignum urinale]MDY5132472.1 SDR family oxidoreductase [Actinotignum urinale]MDY5151054.1 SDR family oxidoreductase [Actinotignum urinale]MDY5154772.1 SDR family oxidoreductase [Actinotignum urinale]WIK58678.1 SDR family oxidoreductase [Actinotignum urinale]